MIESKDMEKFIMKSQTHQGESIIDRLPADSIKVVILRHYADMSFRNFQLTRQHQYITRENGVRTHEFGKDDGWTNEQVVA